MTIYRGYEITQSQSEYGGSDFNVYLKGECVGSFSDEERAQDWIDAERKQLHKEANASAA